MKVSEMNHYILEHDKKIRKLEEDLLYWKEAHIKLQEQHIHLQKVVYDLEK